MHDANADAREFEAYEWITGAAPALVLTCEHASERLPAPWSWPAPDRRLLGTHWSHDIGAAAITRALARALACPAVLSRFTRLLVDPNRALEQPGLFRELAEGEPVVLNADITPSDRARRLDDYYHPYRRAVDRALEQRPGAPLLSIHSFTPLYEGAHRAMEIGVLFTRHERVAWALADQLGHHGWIVALNEPYSAHDGFACCPETHAERHGRAWVELEIRQDIAADPARRDALVEQLAAAAPAAFAASSK
ncbi:MAG: N-formylglutamate amidohydrolase [Myxococcales bacterium]|nr:N-formylglutamate amidohydrolase [Myxococcales bacterium]